MKLLGITDQVNNIFKHLKRDTNQWSFYTVGVGLLVAIPLFSILVYLTDGVGEMWNHIVSYFLFDYIKNSLLLIVGTGFLCFLFGTSTAWIVSRYDFPFKKWIEWILFLPLAIPCYIVAYTYVGLLGNGGLLIRFLQALGLGINKIEMMNIVGLIWVLSCSLFPYVYASARAVFKSLPRELNDASSLLGVSHTRYFYSIALPLAFPAVVGGLFLVFMEVLNDYGAAKYYGINTFTTGIFRSWTMLEDLQSAIYLSAILVLLVLLINTLFHLRLKKESYAFNQELNRQGASNRKPIKGLKMLVLLSVLFIPILFGLVLPIIQLIYWGALTFSSMFNIELLWTALQSIGLGIITTFFVILAALLLIFFARWNHLRGVHFFKKIGTIGYVIPGAIIGIGIIRSSQSIIDFFDRFFQLEIGYLFYGSSIILIFAYVFRFLAVAYNPIELNTLKLGRQLSESSALLGIGKLRTLLKIELPLLKHAIIGAVFLVLIDTLKELPLTLILKPYKLQTLAVQAYAYAEDERVAEAALPALTLILIIGLMMFFVYKRTSNKG